MNQNETPEKTPEELAHARRGRGWAPDHETEHKDYAGKVRQWLREHPGETFKTTEIAAHYGLSNTATVSAELRRNADDGSHPDLIRVNRTTWRLGQGGEYRITRDAPLRAGARLEVVGHDTAGTVIVRDNSGRLWVVRPLELPA